MPQNNETAKNKHFNGSVGTMVDIIHPGNNGPQQPGDTPKEDFFVKSL